MYVSYHCYTSVFRRFNTLDLNILGLKTLCLIFHMGLIFHVWFNKVRTRISYNHIPMLMKWGSSILKKICDILTLILWKLKQILISHQMWFIKSFFWNQSFFPTQKKKFFIKIHSFTFFCNLFFFLFFSSFVYRWYFNTSHHIVSQLVTL